MPQTAFGDLVIAIPGILGSRLARRHGDRLVTVWDFSIRHLPALLRSLLGDRLVLEGNGVDPPDDGVEAVDLFSYQLLPGFFGVDDYASLLDSVRRSIGKRQLLTLPYDWRLSNRHAAERLQRIGLDALERWRAESGNADAKLWLVCHSMGGLVARYFCECLGGAPDTRVVITIGTPHRGSVRALEALVNGKSFGPIDLSRIVRSMPSAYELLPLFPVVRQRSGNSFELKRVAELFGLDPVTGSNVPAADAPQAKPPPSLQGLDRDMLKRALQFHTAIRLPAERRARDGEPPPYRMEAFFNRRQRTPLSAWQDGTRLNIVDTYPEADGAGAWAEDDSRGDGTVPSFSSVPIEWEDTQRAFAVAEKHAQMQAAGVLHDNLFNWLRPQDVRGKKGASVDDADVIALDVPATCAEGDDVIIGVATARATNGFIDVVDMQTGTAVANRPIALAADRPLQLALPPLPAAVYRVSARAADRRLPVVSDYVYVAER